MKKYYYLFVVVFAAMSLCACSDGVGNGDNDGNPDRTEDGNGNGNADNGGDDVEGVSVVGTWKCVAYEGYDSDGEWNEVYDDTNNYWGYKFNEDGTGFDFECEEGAIDAFEIEWAKTENKLTISFYDGDYHEMDVYEIEKLTSSEFVIVEYWKSSDGSITEMEKYTYQRVADINISDDITGGNDVDDSNKDSVIDSEDLIGTWKCIHEVIYGEGEYDIAEGEDTWGWTFTEDTAFEFDFYDGKYDFDDNVTAYRVENNKIIHKYSDGETFSYVINSFENDIMVLAGSRDVFTFKKLSETIPPTDYND